VNDQVPGSASGPDLELFAGLIAPQAQIPCKYFYDDRGSELFMAITRTRDYYVTRTEQAIMEQHMADMAEAASLLTRGVTSVIEPGAGACEKALPLCSALQPTRFVGLDVAEHFMAQGADRLRQKMPWMQVLTLGADILQNLPLPRQVPKGGRVVFYPGTSIGNFIPQVAATLLKRMRDTMGAGGGLLMGIDLVKPVDELERAYDDSEGLTAAFNRNALTHVNRVIGADFQEQHWQHVAVWNPAHRRVEMYLESMKDQWVQWHAGSRHFKRRERILTEFSHKHSAQSLGHLLAQAGMRLHRMWTDSQHKFAVVLARPA
jgi:dimethylhistidine N-methyltransferase